MMEYLKTVNVCSYTFTRVMCHLADIMEYRMDPFCDTELQQDVERVDRRPNWT
jgi:hypothetical protein